MWGGFHRSFFIMSKSKGEEVSKLTVVWLTALLTLGVIFTRHAEAKALFEQRPASVTVASPRSVSSSPHSTALDSNSFPRVPDIITELLADVTQQPCWMQPAQYQRQIHGFARTEYGVKLDTSRGCDPAQQGGQPKLAILESLSGSLSSLSPPGLILRL
jgi:hypothetical protein